MFSRYQLAGFAGLTLAGGLLSQPALAQNQPGVPASAQPIGLVSDSLTLGGTVQAVLDANPGIANLTELSNAAASRLSQTQAGFLPQITGTATYTRLDPVSKVAFGNDVLSFVPNNNFDAHLTAQYELFDFGKRAATTNLSRSQVQTAQDNIQVARRDLAFSAAQTYYKHLVYARKHSGAGPADCLAGGAPRRNAEARGRRREHQV